MAEKKDMLQNRLQSAIAEDVSVSKTDLQIHESMTGLKLTANCITFTTNNEPILTATNKDSNLQSPTKHNSLRNPR